MILPVIATVTCVCVILCASCESRLWFQVEGGRKQGEVLVCLSLFLAGSVATGASLE